MCCLFGLIDYNIHFTQKQKNKIISILSVACEARGTDATGIAYNHNNRLSIYKRPLAAHKMKFDIPNANVIMGHTRMTTQGDEKFNYNNHPFFGKADNVNFALAHNGVLYNDSTLHITEQLPETKIETDSYVAVQLIEKMKHLGFESLGYMAERLSGTFTITVMDSKDNIFFIKGDNPMTIYHFPDIGVYIYASTEKILRKALHKMPFRFGKYKKIEIKMGEILKIDSAGKMECSTFDTDLLCAYNYYSYFRPRKNITLSSTTKTTSTEQEEYIELLKSHAAFYGFDEDIIQSFLDDGYTTDDIEEILFCSTW